MASERAPGSDGSERPADSLRARRPAARLALVLGTLLVSLALLEGGSYVVGTHPGPPHPLRTGSIADFGRRDPLLFWSLRPGALGPDGTRWINADGLRGPELGDKLPGETRILCLGESTTFAARLDHADTYVARTEQLLRDRGLDARVINAGVPAYTVFQGARYLEHRGLDLEPDIVVLMFGYNDFLPVASLAARSGGGAEGVDDASLYARRRTTTARLAAWLTEHSNLYRHLVWGRPETGGEQLEVVPVTTDAGHPRVPELDREQALDDIRQLCAERGIELVVSVPWYVEFRRHTPLLRRFTRQHELTYLDLRAAVRPEYDGEPAQHFRDKVHPTASGHALIAAALADVLAKIIVGDATDDR